MRKSNWTRLSCRPVTITMFTLCLDEFGRNGQAWREADVETTDL
jgi:hypothetical protein